MNGMIHRCCTDALDITVEQGDERLPAASVAAIALASERAWMSSNNAGWEGSE